MTRERRWRALLFGVAALVVSLAASYGAYLLAGYSWNQVVSYESPYIGMLAEETLVPPVPGNGLAERVVLVVVDGLREDVSRSAMPTLDRLRESGADLVLEVPQPSLSYPNWTTILTGATQEIHGVTTNWHDGLVPVPTLFDAAADIGRTIVVAGPTDYESLYDLAPVTGLSLREWPKSGYQTPELVDDALRLTAEHDPDLVVVHLPDLDEAGHSFGGASAEYAAVAAAIDADIARLVIGLEDGSTAFVIVSDHGHVDAGGHGGWEVEATRVPAVLAGSGVALYSGEHRLEDIAPTVTLLSGMPAPQYSRGRAVAAALAANATSAAIERENLFALTFAHTIWPSVDIRGASFAAATPEVGQQASEELVAQARARRLAEERQERLRLSVIIGLAVLAMFLLVVAFSRPAFWSVIAGILTYNAIYNGLYFLVHRHAWSLSAFNTEQNLQAFFNLRMIEAAIAGVLACAVAAYVYPLVRTQPKGPRDGFIAGWLALGPVTVLGIQSILLLQVAWFVWAWGAEVVWTMPDLRWGFKYDLDLIQMTALGGAAVLGPLVTYLVGRYHPVLRSGHGNQGPA